MNKSHWSLFFFLCVLSSILSAAEKDGSIGLIRVEGKIKRISQLADPKKSDYPDCYFIAEFEVHSVISGSMPESVVNLAIPGFADYKYTKYSNWKQDDLISAEIVSENGALKKEKSTQCCDDFNLFENSIYYLRGGEKIKTFSTASAANALSTKKKYVSKWNVKINEPQTEKSVRERQMIMLRDLEELRKQPQESSIDRKTMQKLFEEKTKDLPKFNDNTFWFQNGTGVFAVTKYAYRYTWDQSLDNKYLQDNLSALVELNHFLKSKNVDLILVLYPSWDDIGLRALIPETLKIPIKKNTEMTRYLLEHDVEVIDLAPKMIKMIPQSEFLLYYYHLNNHPGWETQNLAGRLTAERLLRYDLPRTLDKNLFAESRTTARNVANYVYPANLPIAGNTPGSPIMTNVTVYNGKSTQSDEKSPVLTWGNSFLDWPKNHAFVTALAKYSLQFSMIRHGAGCFTTMFKELLIDPQSFLNGKKVMVMPVSVEMIESRKFWNMQTLDQRMMKAGKIMNTIPVHLPEKMFSEKCSDVQKLAEKNKTQGKSFYIQKGEPLEIPVPEFPRKQNCQYYLNIQFYNQDRVVIQAGKKSVRPNFNSLFFLDTAEILLEEEKMLKISPVGRKTAVIFIEKIEIIEIQEEGGL